MTKFIRSEFSAASRLNPYCSYQGKFVARFKYGGRAHFLKFLVKNFTVEEYFALLDSGMSPQTALETKGYINHNVEKALKRAGLAVTRENIPVLLDQEQRLREAREAHMQSIMTLDLTK